MMMRRFGSNFVVRRCMLPPRNEIANRARCRRACKVFDRLSVDTDAHRSAVPWPRDGESKAEAARWRADGRRRSAVRAARHDAHARRRQVRRAARATRSMLLNGDARSSAVGNDRPRAVDTLVPALRPTVVVLARRCATSAVVARRERSQPAMRRRAPKRSRRQPRSTWCESRQTVRPWPDQAGWLRALSQCIDNATLQYCSTCNSFNHTQVIRSSSA